MKKSKKSCFIFYPYQFLTQFLDQMSGLFRKVDMFADLDS